MYFIIDLEKNIELQNEEISCAVNKDELNVQATTHSEEEIELSSYDSLKK